MLWLNQKGCFVTGEYSDGIWWRDLLQSVTGSRECDNKFDIAPNRRIDCKFFSKDGTGYFQKLRPPLVAVWCSVYGQTYNL